MTAKVAERNPLYRAMADISVDVDDLGPEQIADQILADLAAFPVCAPLMAPS